MDADTHTPTGAQKDRAVHLIMSMKVNGAEAGVLAFIDTMAAVARSDDHASVSESGALAAICALIKSGSITARARCAGVLRDLAQHTAVRAAILEAGAIAELTTMLGALNEKAATVEAADALRVMCANDRAICAAVIRQDGVAALAKVLKNSQHDSARRVATGALANVARSDPSSCKAMAESHGVVDALVRTLSNGLRGPGGKQTANWSTSKACVETVRVLEELAADQSCRAALLSCEGAVDALTALMLRAGPQEASAGHAAAILARLVEEKQGVGGDTGGALQQMIGCLTRMSHEECNPGWSLSFPALRAILHASAEAQLSSVEKGTNASAMRAAIEVGKAVELPPERLEAARAAFEEAQAKRRREGMAARAEERRQRKEEAAMARKEEEAVAQEIGDGDDQEKRRRRKEALPAQAKGTATRRGGGAGGEGCGEEDEAARALAEAATVKAMESMAPALRERMLRRMVREGQLGPTSRGPVAEYVQALGLVEFTATPRGGGGGGKGGGKGTNEWKLRESDAWCASPRGEPMARTSRERNARNSLAAKAEARRLARLQEQKQQQRVTGLDGAPGLVASRDGHGAEEDDGSSYTGSSYTGTTVDSGDEAGGAAPSPAAPPAGALGWLASPHRKKWLGGLFSRRDSSATATGGTTDRGGSTDRSGPSRSDSVEATGTDEPESRPRKRHHRRHHRRRRRAKPQSAGNTTASDAGGGIDASQPAFMMPLFSKLQQRAAEELALAAESGDPKVDKWRKRWDEKWVTGGGSSPSPAAVAPRREPAAAARGGNRFSSAARASLRSVANDPIRDSLRDSMLTSSMSTSHASLAPAQSHWGVVRERVGEITAM